jgi:ADP-ribosylglycohydrolase
MLPDERREQYGDIRQYQPNRDDGRRVGVPTDDTQLAFWTLEQMLEDGRFAPDNVAARFCRGRLYGMGGSVREFVHNYDVEDDAWFVAGAASAGNGALMRIAPILIPHVTHPGNLWAETALAAMITHRDSASIAARVSFVRILRRLLERDTPRIRSGGSISTSSRLGRWRRTTPTSHGIRRFRSSTAAPSGGLSTTTSRERTRTIVMPVVEASNYWYSGAYLLETVPTALYVLMRHASDPEEAIVRAATDTKDNDTIGAIVGAAVGALHGRSALPDRWLSGLTGRTRANDDGRAFELLDRAEKQWLGGGV